MANASTFFSSRQSLDKPSCVSIADGSTIEITGFSSDPVTSSFTLDFILHVPHFSFNLMSLSKLIKSLNCSVTFFPHGFMFQDLKTGGKIGGGVERGGLYYFVFLHVDVVDEVYMEQPTGFVAQGERS